MKRLALLLIAAFPMALSAHEFDGRGEHRDFKIPPIFWDNHAPKHGPCADVKLDAAQKAKLKDAFFKYEDERINLKANAEKARLQKLRLLTDPKADMKSAETASAATIDAKTKLLSAKESFKNQIGFEILRADQRAPFFACVRESRHHHHGFDHGLDKKGEHGKWDKHSQGPEDHEEHE